METVVVKGVIARRLKEEAEKLNLTLEEYLLELLARNMNPKDRAREYIAAASSLLVEAEEELEKGNVRQAAEKVWGAAALAVKAYAFWREGKRLTSHGELWEYRRKLEAELGDWVYDAWMAANGMHTCFYENWCDKRDVEKALKAVRKLVEEVKQRIT